MDLASPKRKHGCDSSSFHMLFTNSLVSFLGRLLLSGFSPHLPRCLLAANDYLDLSHSLQDPRFSEKEKRKQQTKKRNEVSG